MCFLHVVYSIICHQGRKRWMWKSSCEWFKLKICKMFMHKILKGYIMEMKMFTFRAKNSPRAKLSQLEDLFWCTTSLTMYEVFNPTILLAFFQLKKNGPMQMQFFSSTRLFKNLFMLFLWCNILVWCQVNMLYTHCKFWWGRITM